MKQVSNGPKIDYQGTCVPYQNLYIYYIEGPLSGEKEPLLGPYFLGNWIEEGSSFLFFSCPAKGAVRTALQNIRLNGLEERVEVTKGLAEDFTARNSDLLIANIHHDTILKLTNAQGFLEKKCFILSGLMRSQARDIRLLLSKYPVEIDHEWSQDMVWHTILGTIKDL